MKRIILYLAGFGLLFLLISCATTRTRVISGYPEEEIPPDRHSAVLIVPSGFYNITTVNDLDYESRESLYTVIFFEPGKNSFEFYYTYTEKTGTTFQQYNYWDAAGAFVMETIKQEHFSSRSFQDVQISHTFEAGYIYTVKSRFIDNMKSTSHIVEKVCPLDYELSDGTQIRMIPEDCKIHVDKEGKEKFYDLEIYTIGFCEKLGILNFIRATPDHNFDREQIYGWVVKDGVSYNKIGNERWASSPYVFSPDESRWAFTEKIGSFNSKMTVSEFGEQGILYDQINSPFAKYSNPLTYIQRDGNAVPYFDRENRLIYRAYKAAEKKWVVVIDGAESRGFDYIFGARFDDDGRLTFTAADEVEKDGKDYYQYYRITNMEVRKGDLKQKE